MLGFSCSYRVGRFELVFKLKDFNSVKNLLSLTRLSFEGPSLAAGTVMACQRKEVITITKEILRKPKDNDGNKLIVK